MDKEKKIIFAGAIGVMLVVALLIVGLIGPLGKSGRNNDEAVVEEGDKSLDELMAGIEVTEAELVKGSVSLGDSSLYDELPEIDKYPTAVESTNKDINLEVFTSGEKAGDGNDAWLIDVATAFNEADMRTADGKTIGVTIRSVSSGLAADYIISGKYVPDMYTPSNTLFGDYAIAQGADIEILNDRLVGNTAGLLITKGGSYKTFDDVVEAVQSGSINLGYTNPQTSASGLNFLVTLLKDTDSANIASEEAASAFSDFNKNIPFVAYTTQQMRDSASNGSLDGMVSEYQTYVNSNDLKSLYDFIPYGIRHDNPLYITSKGEKNLEAVNIFNDFCMSSDMQAIATEYGFNAKDDYVSDIEVSGSEVSKALALYKENKDSGRDIIAVFVADCSGSMDGDAINQLRQSLSNGANYINANNYVGLISYSTDVTIELPIAKFDFNQRAYFEGAVQRMYANGGTSSYEAICVAVDMVKKAKEDNPDAKTMIFLLSDGQANGQYGFKTIEYMLREEAIPIYTISYTSSADTAAMQELSNVNEAASINADSDDVVYKIKSLFNSQL